MNEAREPIEWVLLFQQNPFSYCLSLHRDLHAIISLNDTMYVITLIHSVGITQVANYTAPWWVIIQLFSGLITVWNSLFSFHKHHIYCWKQTIYPKWNIRSIYLSTCRLPNGSLHNCISLVVFKIKGSTEKLSLLGYSVSVDVYIYFVCLLPGESRVDYINIEQQLCTEWGLRHLSDTSTVGIHPKPKAEAKCASKETFLGHDSSLLCCSTNEAYSTAKDSVKQEWRGRKTTLLAERLVKSGTFGVKCVKPSEIFKYTKCKTPSYAIFSSYLDI